VFEGSVGKQARRKDGTEAGEKAEEREVSRIAGVVSQRGSQHSRQLPEPTGELAHGRTKEKLRIEVETRISGFRNDVGQQGPNQGARTDAHVHVEGV